MEIAADKLLGLPIQQPRKIKQVMRKKLGTVRPSQEEIGVPGWKVRRNS